MGLKGKITEYEDSFIDKITKSLIGRIAAYGMAFGFAFGSMGNAGAQEIKKAQDHIAFASKRDGNEEIYVMNADGSNVIRLTKNTVFDRNPAWSPDGKKIAFASGRDGDREIYVMNSDGSNLIKLTDNTTEDGSPSWMLVGK